MEASPQPGPATSSTLYATRPATTCRSTTVRPATDWPYDPFLPYATADEILAAYIAHHLQGQGLRAFFAKWIGLGLVKPSRREAAIDITRPRILLLRSTTRTQPDIGDDYVAILQAPITAADVSFASWSRS
jgi:hypothetical protein